MKIRLLYLLIAAFLTSCTVMDEHIKAPDGTETRRHTKQADERVLSFAGDVVRAYSPREIERRSK